MEVTRYSVGWIAPLPLELTAAKAVLDEDYGELRVGKYTYYGGKIGQHHIVMAVQSRMGTDAASDLAARMRDAFRNIEHFVVVGIGGGVPGYGPAGAPSQINKQWQPYAAATAAAYTKELLEILPASNFAPSPSTKQVEEPALEMVSALTLPGITKRSEWQIVLKNSVGCGKSIIICPPAVIERILQFYAPKRRRPGTQELIDEVLIPLYRTARIQITPADTKKDLEAFVDREIKERQHERLLSRNEAVIEAVKRTILKKADGMFLWAKYLIKMLWEDCVGQDATDKAVYETLKKLPKDLNETYERCLEKVNRDSKRRSIADRVLKWICVSSVPFNVGQLQEALTVDPNSGESGDDSIPKEEILTCCASLAYFQKDVSAELVLLAHHSPAMLPLHAAATTGDAKIVEYLLKILPKINEQYSYALHAACSKGYEEVVQLLLEAGADVNTKAGNLDSPLQAAKCQGHDRVVRLLIDAGIELTIHTLEGHSNLGQGVVFSPDGMLVASGSSDNTVKLWDSATGALRHTLKGHSGTVWDVAFSPDGMLVASGSSDSTVKLWDLTVIGMALPTQRTHEEAEREGTRSSAVATNTYNSTTNGADEEWSDRLAAGAGRRAYERAVIDARWAAAVSHWARSSITTNQNAIIKRIRSNFTALKAEQQYLKDQSAERLALSEPNSMPSPYRRPLHKHGRQSRPAVARLARGRLSRTISSRSKNSEYNQQLVIDISPTGEATVEKGGQHRGG
ncbi:hypothetical protein DL768_001397 [Monosporascus sp. mg162]|nr:hypothetical protein DL768_001397 [Monosporascus sp. mg162]